MADAFRGGIPDSSTTTKALQWMVQQVGKPYIWGGIGPSGFDCSGIGYAGFKAVGAKPNHRFTTNSLQHHGKAVSKSGPFLPGDAILTSRGHMIWAIGNGNAMEFARRGTTGRVTKIQGRTIFMVRRIANPGAPVNASADIVGTAEDSGPWGGAGAFDLLKLAEPLASFFQALTDPRFWVRTAMFGAGMILILVGLQLVLFKQIGRVVKGLT